MRLAGVLRALRRAPRPLPSRAHVCAAAGGADAGATRRFPEAPRVGVAALVLRAAPRRPDATDATERDATSSDVEVLLVRRSKPPNQGQFALPGGGLELGETLAKCAAREVLEETNVAVTVAVADESPLAKPETFTAVDVIRRQSESGDVEFHYALVCLACRPVDPDAVPRASADATDALWVRAGALHKLGEDVVPDVHRVVARGVELYGGAVRAEGVAARASVG